MKKSRSMIGLPVASIKEGREVGQVIDLLVNPIDLRMEFLLVSQGSRFIDMKLLALSRVCGIGEYAVTTESEQMLKDVAEVPEAGSLLETSVDIMDKVVLTRQGDLAGMVAEIYIDEQTGEVVQIEYRDTSHRLHPVVIPRESIVSLGCDVMFINQAAMPQVLIRTNAGEPQVSPRKSKNSSALAFQQKQRQFLMGKEVQRDIRNACNQVIIPRGTVVTGETVQVAEYHNRFGELTQWAR